LSEVQKKAEQELSRRESELKHQIEVLQNDAKARLDQQLQEKNQALQTRLKQREQEIAARADAQKADLQAQWAERLRSREEELERQAEARVRTIETRLNRDLQEKEQLFQAKSRQQEEEWRVKYDGVVAELQLQAAQIEPYKNRLARAENEREEVKLSLADSSRQVQNLEKKLQEATSFFNKLAA
jgi:chromosome segregation ATPase